MAWRDLDTHTQQTIRRALTPKQLDVFILHLAGCSPYRISLMLTVSRRTVRDHLHAAHIRLAAAGVHQDASGRYYTKEAA